MKTCRVVRRFTKTSCAEVEREKKDLLIRTGRYAICLEAAFADLSGRRREQEEKNICILPESRLRLEAGLLL